MCVIAAKPKGIIITDEILRTCFESNSDGAGFVVKPKKGDLIVRKGFFNFAEFLDAYKPYEKMAAVIHFRIRTHGQKDAAMCHPFEVTPDLWMAHNGIIDIDTTDDPTKSDTWHFVDKVLKPEVEASEGREHPLQRSAFRYMLASTIGHSKLAFLDATGRITIINKSLGQEDNGVWYSNGSFRKFGRQFADPRSYGSYNYGTGTTYYGSGWSQKGKTKDAQGKLLLQSGEEPHHAGADDECGSCEVVNEDSIYSKIEEIRPRDMWILHALREDGGMTDDEILELFNSGDAEDHALELFDQVHGLSTKLKS